MTLSALLPHVADPDGKRLAFLGLAHAMSKARQPWSFGVPQYGDPSVGSVGCA